MAPETSGSGRAQAGSSCSSTCSASPEAPDPAPLEEMAEGSGLPWEGLFVHGGLARYLSSSEAGSCCAACRCWRVMATGTVTSQELYDQDVGQARRGLAWKQLLLRGITLQQHAGTTQDSYERLCEKPSSYDSMIRRDVNRTFPQEELFREKNGIGQLALFRLLRALAIRLGDIGYCQSLNFIVATLIGVFPEDEASAFHCALALLLRHSLVDLYRPKFPKLGVVVWQFDRIVEGFLPKVHAALVRHGVNSEYYAIQWFLTLFASDLQQPVVRRIWDRFLLAGWRVLVQVGLALLYTIQDTLPGLDTCHALGFLRRFARSEDRAPEDLLRAAASFKVSHRMLSALEAAYGWEEEVQLLVVKDLDDGQVHWFVQALPASSGAGAGAGAGHAAGSGAGGGPGSEEESTALPRAFVRGSEAGAVPGAEATSGEAPQGTVQPFLLTNLDTGETSVMETAWSEYTYDMDRRARAKSGPLSVRPSAEPSPGTSSSSPVQEEARPEVRPEVRGGRVEGSSWIHSVQQQAVRRLGQA